MNYIGGRKAISILEKTDYKLTDSVRKDLMLKDRDPNAARARQTTNKRTGETSWQVVWPWLLMDVFSI